MTFKLKMFKLFVPIAPITTLPTDINSEKTTATRIDGFLTVLLISTL